MGESGRWALDAELWFLEFGARGLNFALWALGLGLYALDVELRSPVGTHWFLHENGHKLSCRI